MKLKSKKKLLSMVACVLCLSIGAQTIEESEVGTVWKDVAISSFDFRTSVTIGDWYVSLDNTNNVAHVNRYNGTNTDVVVPEIFTYNGVDYVTVGLGDYYDTWKYNYNNGYYHLKSVTLPSTLRFLDARAFNSCCGLTEIQIPAYVEFIGNHAFNGCSNLTEILLPESLKTIDGYAFNDCKMLESMTIPASVTSMGSDPFYGCNKLRTLCCEGAVPPSCSGNFNENILVIYVPKGSGAAYEAVTYWKNRIIVDGEGISASANVDVPGTLGEKLFEQVEYLNTVNHLTVSGILNSDDIYNLQNRMTNLLTIDMSGVVMTKLPEKFFDGRYALQQVVLPEKLGSIGQYAFRDCYNLQDIVLPTTLKSIGYYAFEDCDNFKNIIIPEGVTDVGEYAFYHCSGLQRVQWPSTATTINYATFYQSSIESIMLSEGVTVIGENAFQRSGLKELNCPSTLVNIYSDAFDRCYSLAHVSFNEGLYKIGDNAFYDCDALTEVTLPSSLVLAYESPFDYCDNLMKVTCLSIEPPYMTDQIPYGLEMEGRELYVPAISISTYKQTAGWDKFQTIKSIDHLPEYIAVLSDFRLTLPETIPSDYKPDVSIIHDKKDSYYWQYGSLTVNGTGTLSMSNFSMFWDPNYQYDQYGRSQNYCTLINNSHLRADNVSIDICARNDKWTFISIPFDVKVSDIVTFSEGTTNWVVRKYDGQKRANGETAETWVKLDNDDILNAGEGYILQGSRYIGERWQEYSEYRMEATNNANKNNIFRTTDATIALDEYASEFVHNRSWNLIGNPYPCYYDTRFMDFEAPITVWNMRYSTYEAYSPLDDSYILCPGEAFFVQCPIGKNDIVFSTDGRQNNRDVRTIETPARANAYKATTSAPRTVVNLSLSNESNTDRTRVVLNNNATMLYDMNMDANKFMSTDATVAQIYTSYENVNYAINERPFSDGKISLCTYIGIGGLYTITLMSDVEGYNIVLEDKAENKNIVLTGESSYTFFAEAGTYTGRFVLHIDKEATDIEDIHSEADNADIYSIEGVKMTNLTQKGIYIQNGKKTLLNK